MAGTAIRRGKARVPGPGVRAQAPIIGGGQIPTVHFSTGAARALQAFSQQMNALANTFHDQLDAQAEAEGAFAGASAAEDGSFELQSFGTIRGRAFNKAAAETFVNNTEADTIFAIGDIRRQHANDPAGLQGALQAYVAGKASELDKVSPGAGSAFKARFAARSAASVEAAHEGRFSVVRDRADAALLRNQAAIDAELKSHATNLFHENPKLASASMMGIGQLRADLMGVMRATGPNGKPLFKEKEIAAADRKFQIKAFQIAARSFFERSEDKGEAYRRFKNGDFKVKFKVSGVLGAGGDADVRSLLTPGKAESHATGLKPEFRSRFKALIDSAPDNIKSGLRIFSGFRSIPHQAQLFKNAIKRHGSAGAARRWVAPPGKSNHNFGEAADLSFNGVRLDKAPAHVREWVHQNAPRFGLHFRMGHEPWHIELDKDASTEPVQMTVDILDALPESEIKALDSEFRAQITFENSQADRAERKAEKAQKEEQDANDFETVFRMAATPGEADPVTGKPVAPVTLNEVRQLVEAEQLSPAAGKAIIKAMTSEDETKVSDPSVVQHALFVMHNGGDAKSYIFENFHKLKISDAKSLLTQNRTITGAEGSFNKEQDFYFKILKDNLTPDNILGDLDAFFEERKSNALIEYRQRVQEGEKPVDVQDDIRRRTNRERGQITQRRIDGLLRPRFFVPDEGRRGFIDIARTRKQIIAAHKAGRLSDTAFERQKLLWAQWRRLQDAALRAEQEAGQ